MLTKGAGFGLSVCCYVLIFYIDEIILESNMSLNVPGILILKAHGKGEGVQT